MNIYKLITTFLLLSFSIQAQQSMQKGFELLENGNFADAEIFFEPFWNRIPKTRPRRFVTEGQ